MKHPPPPPPPQAAEVFGDRLDLAVAYAGLLAGPGVEWGLIGPREVERLWDRHILNSAAVAGLIEPNARVIDVGSGAGLPGIPIAIARPDLRVTLLEPMLRRTEFLTMAADTLGLGAEVVRGRAEDPAIRSALAGADAVLSRAVASLDKLARWCLPLVRPGGRMLALKGERAEQEVEAAAGTMSALGATAVRVVRCGDPSGEATVVAVTRGEHAAPRRRPQRTERRGP